MLNKSKTYVLSERKHIDPFVEADAIVKAAYRGSYNLQAIGALVYFALALMAWSNQTDYRNFILEVFFNILGVFWILPIIIHLPRLTISEDGLQFVSLFGHKKAQWHAVGKFSSFTTPKGGSYITADLTGDVNISAFYRLTHFLVWFIGRPLFSKIKQKHRLRFVVAVYCDKEQLELLVPLIRKCQLLANKR